MVEFEWMEDRRYASLRVTSSEPAPSGRSSPPRGQACSTASAIEVMTKVMNKPVVSRVAVHSAIFTMAVMGLARKPCRRPTMKKRLLSVPQLLFVVGTRAVLGAGVALLASGRLSERKRRATGLTLALVGVATTIPAARIVAAAKPSLLTRVAQRFK